MKSLDTNILIYALNEQCAEHGNAYKLVTEIYNNPSEWIIADQVMFELLRALSNPHIYSNPISISASVKVVTDFRKDCGAQFCAYDQSLFSKITAKYSKGHKNRLYDVLLAETLLYAGVTEFYTNNLKDFKNLGFNKLLNPI
jgi:predicted nucleic acid-binding protein